MGQCTLLFIVWCYDCHTAKMGQCTLQHDTRLWTEGTMTATQQMLDSEPFRRVHHSIFSVWQSWYQTMDRRYHDCHTATVGQCTLLSIVWYHDCHTAVGLWMVQPAIHNLVLQPAIHSLISWLPATQQRWDSAPSCPVWYYDCCTAAGFWTVHRPVHSLVSCLPHSFWVLDSVTSCPQSGIMTATQLLGSGQCSLLSTVWYHVCHTAVVFWTVHPPVHTVCHTAVGFWTVQLPVHTVCHTAVGFWTVHPPVQSGIMNATQLLGSEQCSLLSVVWYHVCHTAVGLWTVQPPVHTVCTQLLGSGQYSLLSLVWYHKYHTAVGLWFTQTCNGIHKSFWYCIIKTRHIHKKGGGEGGW